MDRPDAALVEDLERAEIEGYASLWSAAPARLASEQGIDHEQLDGVDASCVRSVPGSRLLNHALGLPVDREPSEPELEAVERFFLDRAAPVLIALAEGALAEARLERRGYARDYPWVKFARDASSAPAVECDLELRPVPAVDASRFGRLLTTAFELPEELVPWLGAVVGRRGWHVLGAYEGSELAATGSLYASGDRGWITWAATDPAFRGRRAQKALLSARVELARELGLRVLVTETGDVEEGKPDASHRNILGAGFRAVYRRPFWRRDP